MLAPEKSRFYKVVLLRLRSITLFPFKRWREGESSDTIPRIALLFWQKGGGGSYAYLTTILTMGCW